MEREYNVTYKDRKNTGESKKKMIMIDLEKYNESYLEDQFILKQYYIRNRFFGQSGEFMFSDNDFYFFCKFFYFFFRKL